MKSAEWIEPMAMTPAELKLRFPNIDWIDPLPVHYPDCVTFACRVCIANKGLTKNSDHQWSEYLHCLEHINEEHPWPDMLHVLIQGRALCGFSMRVPGEWPKGHMWIGLEEKNLATCPDCKRIADVPTPETEEEPE
jgi:hypothetical protein